MLDILFTATAAQLGKVVLEQVLELGQGTLEDYAQDFFKDSLGSGVAKLKASVLKGPMGEAVGAFIKTFVQELKDNDVPDSSIQHHYTGAIQKLVKDKAVKPILGQAFETSCELIDYEPLKAIWTSQYQQPGWGFPDEDFRWKRVAKKYGAAVKGIVKADGELRSLLTTELLEQIAQNTTPFSPGFDIKTYRKSLQASYGYLKLYTLDSTDRVDAIKLWNMFIEQTVREALPPTRYDLPLDIKRRLQAEGQLEETPTLEDLEYYQRDYFQQPARKALDAVMDAERSVILGDPGAGKSTLLQYLALEWVESKTDILPLLIELREYVLAQFSSFLDFLHAGSGADWQFDQQQLHQYLSEQPTLMMFDGLDEVFDRPTQSAIIDDIIRFAQQYPQTRVVVTSRIIGYNPEKFRHADFRQFTIQPLDETEIHEFIDRWYDLAMGADPDKVRLKARLKEAISQSKAIQNLADNPLLLTMMAILNRRQELPRDRADLYDQASRVLLYHWDVDHKRLQLPLDAIGRREKQEMLRLIAYEMQAGEDGLKGNLISADRLTKILTDYLINQGFSEPREKASRLIQQLRERNFILCYRGADTYGFMHRTFLEYFCAVEIVHRFEKQRTLTFEQLRDDIFGQHWQDESWNEVLRLICGLINTRFAENLITLIVNQRSNNAQLGRLSAEETCGLVLSIQCLAEVKNLSSKNSAYKAVLKNMKQVLEDELITLIYNDAISKLSQEIAFTWSGDQEILVWLKEICIQGKNFAIPFIAVPAISMGWKEIEDTLDWFKYIIKNGKNCNITQGLMIEEVARVWKQESSTLTWLKTLVNHPLAEIQRKSVETVAKEWKSEETFSFLKEIIREHPYLGAKEGAIRAISQHWESRSDAFSMIQQLTQDDAPPLRAAAIKALASGWRDEPTTFNNVKAWILDDESVDVRIAGLQALVSEWSDEPDVLSILKTLATDDDDESVRATAINCARKYGQNSIDILNILKTLVVEDRSGRVRHMAMIELATVWKDRPDILQIIQSRALLDKELHFDAVRIIAEVWGKQHELVSFFEGIVTNTSFDKENDWRINPRRIALEVLLRYHADFLKNRELLCDRATNDSDPQLREWAQKKLDELNQTGGQANG